jgi:enterochelin esterase-like enzyme
MAALVGWRLRLPGGGRRFAAADDYWRLLGGQMPRYGAVPYTDSSGDLALWPSVARDEERLALGIPGRAEQQQRLDEDNRRRAEARWAQGGLPSGESVARVWRRVTAAELEARWATERSPVWRDGDVLTVVHRAEAEQVQVLPGVQQGMWRVDGDLWALMVRVRDLDRAALNLSCVAISGGQLWGQALPEPVQWRGPNAPAVPTRAEPLAGELRDVMLDSHALGERRALTVYLPPGRWEGLPVLYLADGGSAPRFAAVLEAGVAAGATPAAVLVGVHSAVGEPDVDLRGREYVPGMDPRRFAAHERFFVDEVAAWVERELGGSADRERRAVAGYSNGAVLASALGCRHPDRFGAVVAFSLGVEPPLPSGARPARHYLVAGTLEAPFHRATRAWAAKLRELGVEVEERERVCGHDQLMWEEEMPAAIRWAFGSS